MTQYLTIKDIKAMLKVSEQKATEIMVAAGAVNVGFGAKNNCWRLSQDKLNAWLESRTAQAPQDEPVAPIRRKQRRQAAPEIDWREGLKKRQAVAPVAAGR